MPAPTYTQVLAAVLARLDALEALIEQLPANPTPGIVELDTRLQALQGKLTAKLEG